MRKKKNYVSMCFLLSIIFVFIGYPLLFLLSGSIKGNDELIYLLSPILNSQEGKVTWKVLPHYPTLRHYLKTMIDSPEFWVLFWNSVKIVCLVVGGQILVSIPAAWGFVRCRFKGKKSLFRIYMLLMLLPFQVRMLSDYLILDKMNLLDTHWAIVMPGIFSTFPVFIMYQFLKVISQEIIESAKLDGADEWMIFIKIGVPLGKNGILSVLVLSIIEYWNIIEQPLVFLKNRGLWPVSMYMPVISYSQTGSSFATSIVIAIPLVIVFFTGQRYLQKGIDAFIRH